MIANIIRNAKKTVTGGDPYYSAVSLLLPMDGTNGSTTFTDSGPNTLTITPTGTTISTSQAKYGASGYFNGTSAYLTAASSAITLGTSDFTIEFWIYPLDVRTFSLYDSRTNETNPNGNGFVIGTSASQAWVVYQAANRIVGPAVAANQWTHVAVTRSGSSVKMWINGVQVGSTWTTTGSFSDGATLIGTDYPKNARFVYGYLDDFRISLFARYVSTFTPPTAALPTTASSTPADPYYGYTSLLLHMDGTNASTAFVDSGPSALAVTAAANAQISTTQVKYGSASGYFDGTGDSLTIPANTALALGAGDYTIEGWFYSLTSGTSLRGMIDFRTAATGTNGLMLRENDGGFLVYLNSATILSTTTGRVANQWQHVALVRKGTTVTLYVDGVSRATATSSTTLTDNVLRISGFVDTQSNLYTYNGYIDDLRITKYARYTSAFAPPAQAHLEYANGNDRHFSNVSLLLHMDGANGSTTFTDNSANALAVTRTGTPTISTSQSVFGGSSLALNGSSYLTVANNAAIAFGLEDFTIECWVNFSALPASGVNMSIANTMTSPSVAGFTHWWLGLYNNAGTNVLYLGRHGNGAVYAYSNWTPALNTWYHVAVTRSSGSVISLFINGVSQSVFSSGSNWANNFSATGILSVGYVATAAAFNGFMDEFRLTKGVARYTSNFTPPTSAFPNA